MTGALSGPSAGRGHGWRDEPRQGDSGRDLYRLCRVLWGSLGPWHHAAPARPGWQILNGVWPRPKPRGLPPRRRGSRRKHVLPRSRRRARGWNGCSRETAPRWLRRKVREGRPRPASPAVRGTSHRGAIGSSPMASEAAAGMLAVASEAAEKVIGPRKAAAAPPQRNKGNLPAHLPRIEQVIEPESILCPCGCGAMQRVGESRTERLDPPRENSPPDCFLILVDPGAIPRAGDGAPEICLPDLRGGTPCPGSGTGMAGAARPADRGAGGALHGRQIRRLPAVLPSGGHLSPPG